MSPASYRAAPPRVGSPYVTGHGQGPPNPGTTKREPDRSGTNRIGSMRVSVTLVESRTDRRADVLLQADDETPFGEVATELLSAAQSSAHQEVISLAAHRELQL